MLSKQALKALSPVGISEDTLSLLHAECERIAANLSTSAGSRCRQAHRPMQPSDLLSALCEWRQYSRFADCPIEWQSEAGERRFMLAGGTSEVHCPVAVHPCLLLPGPREPSQMVTVHDAFLTQDEGAVS
uniref:Uncharacterized protein n=1 Tax=Calcidiscus leptoporus TaxID=127549 RepID=A0A7S0P689_9EUKA